MNVADIRGRSEDWLIGPEQGTQRLFVWAATLERGHSVGKHLHHGEELFRVLYGRLRFLVESDVREVRAGEIVIIPPGTIHGYTALQDSELEIYGEIACGVFTKIDRADGSAADVESYVRGLPWTRIPPAESMYTTRDEQLMGFEPWDTEIED
jgi:hypothetical protein